MNAIRAAFLVVLVSLAISFGYSQESDEVRKATGGLQGQWSMVSGSADGQPMPTEMLKQMKRICKGNQVATTMAGRTGYKVNRAATYRSSL